MRIHAFVISKTLCNSTTCRPNKRWRAWYIIETRCSKFSAAEVAKLCDKMKPVIDKHSAAVGPMVAEVQAELAKLRK
jgi:hypothetical protein